MSQVEKEIPIFHTRAMRKEFRQFCGRLCNMKPAVLRAIYKQFVGDHSAGGATEAEIDTRIRLFLDAEDEDIILDLRSNNPGRPRKYEDFFQQVEGYLNDEADTAVDDRRHGTVVHRATALSAPKLLAEVKKRCPPETAIPSEKWLYLLFWPTDATKRSALKFTGRFAVKYMVQARLFRKEHPDIHYASDEPCNAYMLAALVDIMYDA